MDPEVLGDLVAPSRRRDAPAYRHAEEPARCWSYETLCTTTWRTANLLRLYGVHTGATVGIVDAPKEPGATADDGRDPATPIPEVIGALLGAGLLGAVVEFDPDPDFEGAALLCPAAVAAEAGVGPECTVLAYGGPPADPSVVHFEEEVWSETPIAPPESVRPDADVLAAGRDRFDHATLLGAAAGFADEQGLDDGDTVAVDASLAEPGTVVAGVIAPLLVGAAIQVGGGSATVRIGDGGIAPATVRIPRPDGRNPRA